MSTYQALYLCDKFKNLQQDATHVPQSQQCEIGNKEIVEPPVKKIYNDK